MPYSRLCLILMTLTLSILICGVASADPGETDENEGHFNQKTGVYHYHRTVTQPPVSQDIITIQSQAITAAEADAVTDARLDRTWYGAGFLFGVFGMGAAYVITPHVPPRRLLGKAPEHIVFYTDAYQQAMRRERVQQATTGCLVWGGVLAFYYLYSSGQL